MHILGQPNSFLAAAGGGWEQLLDVFHLPPAAPGLEGLALVSTVSPALVSTVPVRQLSASGPGRLGNWLQPLPLPLWLPQTPVLPSAPWFLSAAEEAGRTAAGPPAAGPLPAVLLWGHDSVEVCCAAQTADAIVAELAAGAHDDGGPGHSAQSVEMLSAAAGADPVQLYTRAAAAASTAGEHARVLSLVQRANTGVPAACVAFVAVDRPGLAAELMRYALNCASLPRPELEQVANLLLSETLRRAALEAPDRLAGSGRKLLLGEADFVLRDFLVSNPHYDCQRALEAMASLCCGCRTAEQMMAVGLARDQSAAALATAEQQPGGVLLRSVARLAQRMVQEGGTIGRELQPEVLRVAETLAFLPTRDWKDAMLHKDSLALRGAAVVRAALGFLDGPAIGALAEYFDRWVHASPTEQELLTGTQLNGIPPQPACLPSFLHTVQLLSLHSSLHAAQPPVVRRARGALPLPVAALPAAGHGWWAV